MSLTIPIFLLFVLFTLALSFYLGHRAKSAAGYFAAGGQIHWFVNGIAFAGDYLSAASFLGICGWIAFYGYDGFLYSIGYLAGWVVALFVIAEPLKRMGKYTFADALDSRFQSRGIKLSVAISTLAVSVFYLIPQMVGAGTLIKPLLGYPHYVGVIMVGTVVILIVATAGMVSTTYVQFMKGSLLVLFSTILVGMILFRGLEVKKPRGEAGERIYSLFKVTLPMKFDPRSEKQIETLEEWFGNGWKHDIIPAEGAWKGKPYLRTKNRETGKIDIYRVVKDGSQTKVWELANTQAAIELKSGEKKVELTHRPLTLKHEFQPVGHLLSLGSGATRTGPVGPLKYLEELGTGTILVWGSELIVDGDTKYTIYYPTVKTGAEMLLPGNYFKVRTGKLFDKIDFLSLMLALFCGTASLPHILIRYYTVKDQAAARLSTIVGIASIGFFYILTLYIGLGAMISGALDVTNSNMAAPLLAKSFSEWLFACISAIAFTTVLGTVSGLIVAASGAIVHDLLSGVCQIPMSDHTKIRVAKLASVIVGIIAIVLGILFEKMNVALLVGWAFSIAASANLPALIMLLFWKGTTKQGITAAVTVGMVTSLTWVLLSEDTYKNVYGINPADAIVPFSQPGIITIPLSFAVLVVVSLMTKSRVTSA